MNPAEAMRYLADQGRPFPVFEDVERALRLQGLAFPIAALVSEELSPEAAYVVWRHARTHTANTGLVPVLLGAEPMADFHLHDGRVGSTHEFDPTGDLAAPRLLARIQRNVRAYRETERPELLKRLEARAVERFSAPVVERLRAAMQGLNAVYLVKADQGMPPGPSEHAAPYQFLHEPEPVRCVLLGCQPWEVPLYLGLGGAGTPSAAEQARVLEGWSARYGTEIVHVGRSVLATRSEDPPRRIDDLRVLLWESFLYCWDAVFRDADDAFPDLRAMLSGQGWQFWWDDQD